MYQCIMARSSVEELHCGEKIFLLGCVKYQLAVYLESSILLKSCLVLVVLVGQLNAKELKSSEKISILLMCCVPSEFIKIKTDIEIISDHFFLFVFFLR